MLWIEDGAKMGQDKPPKDQSWDLHRTPKKRTNLHHICGSCIDPKQQGTQEKPEIL